MISNQILQGTIDGLKSISRVELCVVDTEGKEVVSTTTNLNDVSRTAREFATSPADSQEIQGYSYFKIYDEAQLEYILIAAGTGEDVYMIGKMVAFQIQNLIVAYKERFDKDNFVKNLLLDNLLLVDIYSRAKKLHIQADAKRVALIIESESHRDFNVLEAVRTHFGSNSKDFITAVDESDVIIVKEVEDSDHKREIERAAKNIITTLEKAGMENVHVAYGTVVNEIKEVSALTRKQKWPWM